jgi:(p)ppGpp synthase/HD superfamily hydrolase
MWVRLPLAVPLYIGSTMSTLIIRDAIGLVSRKHKSQKYGSQPYFYHLHGVAEKVRVLFKGTTVEQTVAYLHDVIEDTDVTYEYLVAQFGHEVADPVRLLTRTDDQEYDEYLEALISDPVAKKVKLADALFNLEHSVAEGSRKRIKKYSDAIARLTL